LVILGQSSGHTLGEETHSREDREQKKRDNECFPHHDITDVIFYVNPCQRVPVERIVEITGGRRVVIVADIKP
jgi:hypothetical protein